MWAGAYLSWAGRSIRGSCCLWGDRSLRWGATGKEGSTAEKSDKPWWQNSSYLYGPSFLSSDCSVILGIEATWGLREDKVKEERRAGSERTFWHSCPHGLQPGNYTVTSAEVMEFLATQEQAWKMKFKESSLWSGCYALKLCRSK